MEGLPEQQRHGGRKLVRSSEYFRRAQGVLGGGVSSGLRASMRPHPIFFERGEGARAWDVDGNEYIDYVMAWGPLILGHSHPAVVAAVAAQLPLGQMFGSGHRWEYEVAERVVDIVPAVDRLLWSNTGSEAVQVALRLARGFTGRNRVIKFAGHYHGWTDEVLVGYRKLGSMGAEPESRGQRQSAHAAIGVLPWNDLGAVVEEVERYHDDIAAIIMEPILCNSGVISPMPGYLESVRHLCDDTGILLIFDEVITGFRVARGGAAELYQVWPDLVVFGKALAGGFSLSAVGGRTDIIDQTTKGVVHAGTYNGNPVVLAAAAATLDILGERGTYTILEERGRLLAAGLSGALAAGGIQAVVNQVGSVVQIMLGVDVGSSVESFLRADWAAYDRLAEALLQQGVFVLPGGRWYLSTAHTEEDIKRTVERFKIALDVISTAGAA